MSKLGATKIKSLAQKYKADFIVSDGSIIKCDVCDTVLKVDLNHQNQAIEQHLKTLKHRELAAKRKSKSSQQTFLASSFQKADEQLAKNKRFESDLTRAFIQSGIPLFKVNSEPLRNFLAKYTERKIPDESTLRKNYIKPVFDEIIEKIRLAVGDSNVCFIVDETTDALQRFVFNVLVMPLNGKLIKPMLLKMYNLEKANNSTVMRSVIDACGVLWPGGIQYDKVISVVSDQAAYMVLAVTNLKALFPNLHHVTCLAHSLHRVCESVRNEYSNANEFIGSMRKVLLKAPARIQLYKETTGGLALPPDAVVTRWGSWISCAAFLCENYDKIKSFLDELPDDSKACEISKRLVNDEIVKDELFNCTVYKFLVQAIEKLESSTLTKDEQWRIFKETGSILTGFAKDKFDASLQKNPDVVKFATNDNPQFRLETMFAPLVSVDVERSFSQYKSMLTDRRHNLTFENIEMLSITAFNKCLID